VEAAPRSQSTGCWRVDVEWIDRLVLVVLAPPDDSVVAPRLFLLLLLDSAAAAAVCPLRPRHRTLLDLLLP